MASPQQLGDIYKKAVDAINRHQTFLSANKKNVDFYYFGKDVSMVQNLVTPLINLSQTLQTYTPEEYNPLAFFVNAFMEEIANTDFVLDVRPYPVEGREPYEAFANQLEDYLTDLHRRVARSRYTKQIVFELLSHSYFGIYTTGNWYWFLSAYNLIPGDEAVSDSNSQPFWVRITQASKAKLEKIATIDLSKEFQDWSFVSDLEMFTLYDVWVKELDVNVLYTASGQVIYQQPFPFPKRYPIFIGSDNELFNNFYSKPMLYTLRQLLPKYQDSLKNIEENSKSIGTPILTYDADCGIDINKLQMALKEGYKRIILGKNREGQIQFHAPGQLPMYSLQFPEIILKQMMQHLGITETFLGTPTRGVRERGALGTLVKTSFRKLGCYAGAIQSAFTELDNYLLEYMQYHKYDVSKNSNLKNIEEIFDQKIKYLATDRFLGFGSQDTSESRNETMTKRRLGIIPEEQVLKELGYPKPRKVIEAIREEVRQNREFEAQTQAAGTMVKSILDQVAERLQGKLTKRFYLVPISDNKILIKCSEADQRLVAFLLSDFASKVLIEPLKIMPVLPPPEKTVEVTPPQPIPVAPEVPPAQLPKSVPVEETRGRPPEKIPGPEEIKKAMGTLIKKEGLPAEARKSSPPFSEDRLKDLVRRTSTLHRPDKFLNLPGLYIVEPHAKWINSGKKLALLKAKKFDIVDKPYLLCGDKVYGVIIVRDILEDFDVEATRKFHLVSPAEAQHWWKGNKLYLYLFEYHPFVQTLNYERPQGVQTFIKKVNAEKIGLPYKGDIKPMAISPRRIPPAHKPEKKAFRPQEVFTVSRLMDIIPDATYDVSEKIDGLRCFAWVVDGKAQLYSDVGNKFESDRVSSITERLPKVFKHNTLVDGEIVMEGIRRKDVAGYIHGKWKPTETQLASLRYVCWDVLYVKDQSIASRPFHDRSAVLDLYLSKGCQGPICRVRHDVEKRSGIPTVAKKLSSTEGIVIRDVNASYWATHTTYKMKYQFDVDAKVIAVEKTKLGLPVFYCVLKDGTFIGKTYAQSEVKAVPGDVIRVNVDFVTTRPDGSINWYGPKPKSWKEGKITPKKISTTQVGIGGPDTLDLVKEIFLATGGSIRQWDEWYPKFLEWKKDKMLKLIEKIKKE